MEHRTDPALDALRRRGLDAQITTPAEHGLGYTLGVLIERYDLVEKPLIQPGAVSRCERAKTQVPADSGAMIFPRPTPPVVFLKEINRQTELAGQVP
jgi:hypothetical protein